MGSTKRIEAGKSGSVVLATAELYEINQPASSRLHVFVCKLIDLA